MALKKQSKNNPAEKYLKKIVSLVRYSRTQELKLSFFFFFFFELLKAYIIHYTFSCFTMITSYIITHFIFSPSLLMTSCLGNIQWRWAPTALVSCCNSCFLNASCSMRHIGCSIHNMSFFSLKTQKTVDQHFGANLKSMFFAKFCYKFLAFFNFLLLKM